MWRFVPSEFSFLSADLMNTTKTVHSDIVHLCTLSFWPYLSFFSSRFYSWFSWGAEKELKRLAEVLISYDFSLSPLKAWSLPHFHQFAGDSLTWRVFQSMINSYCVASRSSKTSVSEVVDSELALVDLSDENLRYVFHDGPESLKQAPKANNNIK